MHGSHPSYNRRIPSAGRLIRATLALVVLLLLPSPAFAQEALRGVALVIGQSEYEYLSPLPNPANDADAIEALLSDLGFDSVRRADRKASNLAKDLERFAEDAQGADVAVLYYSGHGIEAGGENWLVPVDADLSALDDAGEKLVPVSAVLEKLKATVPVVIVMLDACRNNPFPPGSELRLSPGGEPLPVGNTGLALSRSVVSLKATSETAPSPDENVGTVIAFAAEPGKVALDGDAGSNSPYAAALLRHFDAMAGEEFGMVMRMVAEEVYLKTGGRQRPWVNESLRRLLYFGEKPSELSGDEGDILRERRGLLITIAALPDPERRTIETVASDTGVPMDALYGMLKALGTDVPEDPGQLDTLLRGQTEKVKAMIAERDTLKSTDPEIVRLSNLADQALAEGALNTAISLRQQAKARAQEVEATVEDAEEQLRQRRLELAEVYAKSAEAYALAFKHREAGKDYEEASRQVDRWDEEQAFWYMRSASTAYLEAGKLRGGVADFERASETGKRSADMAERLLADHSDDERQYWEDISAQTLNNWANATNALYSASKRREALTQSIDAYERALKILNRDRVEQDWVVVQHNLAGALMLLGETEAGNATLERSIEAYKASLTVWTRENDPEKWALAIANMGNAQTSLGERTRDQATLREAIASLTSALDVQTEETTPLDWAWTQREIGDAWGALAELTKDENDVRRSTAARQEALKVYTLDRAPRSWAQTLHDMAVDELDGAPPEKRLEALRRSSALYQQVLAAIAPEELPVEYALSVGNLGSAYVDLGKAKKDPAMVERGVASLRQAIDLYDQMQRPLDMAFNMVDVGAGLVALGSLRSSSIESQQAIDIYQQAAALYRQNGEQDQADGLRRNLAYAQVELGYQRSVAGDNQGAVEAYQAALDNRDRETDAQNWVFSANQLGIALQNQGTGQEGVDTLRRAADTYRLALSATPDDNSDGRQETQDNLTGVLRTIAERTLSKTDYIALSESYGASVAIKERSRSRDGRDLAMANRAWALALAGEYGSDFKLLEQAAAIYRSLPKTADMAGGDRLFHALNFSRTLYLVANAGGGDPARRESIAIIDDNWPLIEKEGSAEQKINALVDRANLIHAISYSDPKAFTPAEIEAAFARAISVAGTLEDPALLRVAQRALAAYQFTSVDDPAFTPEQMRSGLATLRDLLAATPRQTEQAAWAEVANWYGYALSLQGKRESNAASFQEALPFLRDALTAYQATNDGLSVAHTQDSLCSALVGLGRLEKRRELVAEGVENCDRAVAYMRANDVSQVLPVAEANQAEARKALAEFAGGVQ
ncbi:MAG: caspase family protein [Mesorhizobium sp.]|nr:caspase family protein [Mesorhizobium sp.]MBL8577032.1 caspase family protein [Mesorhizobium sp.]